MSIVVGFKKIEAVFKKAAGLELDKSKADKIIDNLFIVDIFYSDIDVFQHIF